MTAVAGHKTFIEVDGRQSLVVARGEGPVVVLLHDAARSHLQLGDLAATLSARRTVITVDLPGCGLSDAHPDARSVSEMAEHLARLLPAAGVATCAMYGIGLGACVALAFALGHPTEATALLLEDLPFDRTAAQDAVAHAEPAVPRLDGGHLLAEWHRARERYLFYPSFRPSQATRISADVPPPSALHDAVMDALRCGPAAGDLRKAAMDYDAAGALATLAEQTTHGTCATVLWRQGDGRQPAVRAAVAAHPRLVARELDARPDFASEELLSILDASDRASSPQTAAAPTATGGHKRVHLRYASTPEGQLLVRCADAAPGRPIVLLHASPGSGALLGDLVNAMAPHRPVYAIDVLGNGDSDRADPTQHPAFRAPQISDYAAVILSAVDNLGLGDFDLYGTHSGALTAAEMALLAPERIPNLILEGVPLLDGGASQELIDRLLVDLTPAFDASHLIRAWSVARATTLWFPWYAADREHEMDYPVASAAQVQDLAIEMLKSGATYPLMFRAALSYPARERLPLIRSRTLVTAHARASMNRFREAAAALIPGASTAVAPMDPGDSASSEFRVFRPGPEAAEFFLRFLRDGDLTPSGAHASATTREFDTC